MDFLNEGRNSERCAKELSKFPHIYVPKVHWDLCSKVRHINFPPLYSMEGFCSHAAFCLI